VQSLLFVNMLISELSYQLPIFCFVFGRSVQFPRFLHIKGPNVINIFGVINIFKVMN
jgi:hypothetical protein